MEDLVWWPDKSYGFYPAKPSGKYDASYWKKYEGYKETEVGIKLTSERVAFVERYCKSFVVDIGIGCGQFIEARGLQRTRGYDVNLTAIQWLLDRNSWFDPYAEDPENVTFWDSLEHLLRPADLVRRVKSGVFISIPIFSGPEHVLKSKHFRKDEHFWYFTEKGLVAWMAGIGFSLLESGRMEEKCGREDIGTFAFIRSTANPEIPS